MKQVLHLYFVLIKVGILDQNEAGGTETLREFQDKFGAASCVFLKCDVTDSDQFRGKDFSTLFVKLLMVALRASMQVKQMG